MYLFIYSIIYAYLFTHIYAHIDISDYSDPHSTFQAKAYRSWAGGRYRGLRLCPRTELPKPLTLNPCPKILNPINPIHPKP